MSGDDEREQRLKSLRDRVRDELAEEGVIEVEEESLSVSDDGDVVTLSDRIARRRRRMRRAREGRRQAARMAALAGEEPTIARLPAAFREHSEENWVVNLAVLLILVGSILGAATGALLISADPRDLVTSSMFSRTDDTEVHGLVLSQMDTVNKTGGEGIVGADVEVIRLADSNSEGRTETNSEGRFTFTGIPREDVLLRIEMDGYITIERKMFAGEIPDLTITMVEGEGVDSQDLRQPSNLASAVQLSTAIAVLTLISAGMGIAGAHSARSRSRYRRTQWLCGFGLFSRGGIFFGPLMILIGMALLMLAKSQFEDQQ